MLYDSGNFDSTLTAAAGDDPELMRELRLAFAQSLEKQIDLLSRSRCDGNWEIAALRLKSLAAGFFAEDLMKLADEAMSSAPGDPVILRKLTRFHDHFIAM